MTEKPIAIVTGVGPGTGAAIVKRFSAGGFRIVALARSAELINRLAQELPDVHAVTCDVSDESEVATLIDRAEEEFGPVDLFCANAGVGHGTGLGLSTVHGIPTYAGELTVRYLSPVPIGEELEFEAWVQERLPRRMITAARADRSSFGCEDRRRWTYFGDAYFNQALRQDMSFTRAFDKSRRLITLWETTEKLVPSLPIYKDS